jgi:(heptosyl)LPS beta-1,4-glucosyltransferase
MEKLSVVIITFNEERNIAACLDAVADLSDDIVIVDSLSTDRTEEICSSYPNVNFVKREWQGYSKTKNYANSLAKHSYILSLDADEVLSPELKKSIQQIAHFDAVYEFSRLTNYCGSWVHHCGWYPDRKIRIFPKEGSYWEGDFVHETLVVPEGLPVVLLKGDLWHYSYHSLQDHYNQIEKYSTLHAEKMKHEGKKPSMIKEYISPAFKFFRTYFLELGFLDGKAGFDIARISAKAVRLKYKKLKALYR